ncbi:hypothetical protein PUN28_013049 [Cardiocondyla obscurior]|uniref:Uncharacterized protein n=1 Tax=Cardiocondyla obscurior TaxID=286306 RepID=A0AAW2FAQ5_9HYME
MLIYCTSANASLIPPVVANANVHVSFSRRRTVFKTIKRFAVFPGGRPRQHIRRINWQSYRSPADNRESHTPAPLNERKPVKRGRGVDEEDPSRGERSGKEGRKRDRTVAREPT